MTDHVLQYLSGEELQEIDRLLQQSTQGQATRYLILLTRAKKISRVVSIPDCIEFVDARASALGVPYQPAPPHPDHTKPG